MQADDLASKRGRLREAKTLFEPNGIQFFLSFEYVP